MKSNRNILRICRVGLFSALLALGAWIAIPLSVPITMQTFVLFFMAGTLPLSESVLSVAIYLSIGLAGLPIFAGFSSGIGTLMGPTGGFLLGFFPAVLLFGSSSRRIRQRYVYVACAIVSLLFLYACGCVWYACLYGKNGVITACVLPFLPADAIKLAVALPLARRMKRHVR